MASSFALFNTKKTPISEVKTALSSPAKVRLLDPPAKTTEVKESSPLDDAVEKFDYWMKKYNHKASSDNELLLRWLTYNHGVKYAPTYTLFHEIAEALSKRNYKTSPPPSESDYRNALGLHLEVPESKKPFLREIQKKFSGQLLTLHDSLVHFTHEEGFFLYANDSKYISNYLSKLFNCMGRIKNTAHEFTLLQALWGKKNLTDIGIVIGNSHILSLLPDFPLEVFLLLDVEPRVHLFLLKIKELILNTNDNDDFETLRMNLIMKINFLQGEIEKHLLTKNVIGLEMKQIGDKHFLSSAERFAKCKKALQTKELLPVKVDMFNPEQVEEFGVLLKKAGCQIAFMNLTNIADYDNFHLLSDMLNHLPFTANTVFISTSLIGFNSRPFIPTCFVSIGRDEVNKRFVYSYDWNTPRDSYGSWGLSFG